VYHAEKKVKKAENDEAAVELPIEQPIEEQAMAEAIEEKP
jgi:hypothetical protein